MMSYRSDFPIFTTHPDLVYLDSAATSQKPQSVIDAVSQYLSNTNSNIHRGAYQIAEQSEDLYRASKARFAAWIGGASEAEVIYHYNATACYNLLTQSLIQSKYLTPGDSIILSTVEHHANIVPRQMIAEQYDLTIRWLPLDEDYTIDRSVLPSLIDKTTKVISLSAFSNVTGDIPDLSRVRPIVGDDVFFCIDASQLLGKYPIDVSDIGADALIGTAHKMMGLTGLGMMRLQKSWIKSLTPARGGGGAIADVTQHTHTLQSDIHGRESGTPNVVGAISLLAAIDYIDSIGGVSVISQHDQDLTSYTLQQLQIISGLSIIGSNASSLTKEVTPGKGGGSTYGREFSRGGVISFTLDGVTKNSLAQHCADHQIAIRCGGHCTFPLRQSIDQAGGCRISFHIYTSTDDIDTLIDVIRTL